MSGFTNAGLLQPTNDDLSRLAPTTPYQQPASVMYATYLKLGRDSADEYPDEPDLPPELDRYRAALQPYVSPAGTPWQEEVVFDTITRDDDSMQSQMQSYFSEAENYDRNLMGDRIKASDYYNGMPLGDEEPGRSQLVVTTVRDTIRATMPSLMRVFTGVEDPIEFTPNVSDNAQLGVLHADLARQATSYVHWAVFTANEGWTILHDAILDALTRRVGWLRWYWGEQRSSRIEVCDRLLEPQARMLLQEPGVIAQRIVRRPMRPSEIRSVMATPEGAAYLNAGGQPIFWAIRLTRATARAWPIVEYVRSEAVWVVPDAETPSKARAIFHIRDLPASDLIAAGLPADKVLKAAGSGLMPRMRQELAARDRATGNLAFSRTPGPEDPSMRMVRYVEGWWLADTDGDNVAELIHSHAISNGGSVTLIQWERTDEIPLGAMTPYREPGRIIGLSQSDLTMDLQRTETRVMRGVLDSLGQSLYPRTVITMGQVNVEDARQTAIGSIIRVTTQGAVQELSKPFVGGQALPVLDVLQAIRESRTGITRTSQGLTADRLQSTTPRAVSAQTSASEDRIELIARTLAETGLKDLYRGVLKMMARHQDRPNVLSIRGKWVTIDPRALSIQWALQVNVGKAGSRSDQLAVLNAIATKQEQILAPAVQQGQLDTPIVGLPEYRNTLARMTEVAGFSDVSSYFKELPPGWTPPPPVTKPSTDEVLAEVEKQKTQAEMLDEARQADLDRTKMFLEDDRARDQAALDAWVKAYQIAATAGTPLPSIDDFREAMGRDPIPSPAPPSASAGPLGLPPGAAPGGDMPGAGQAGIMMPSAPPGSLSRVPSLPLATPPQATPSNGTAGIDPAAVLAMRQSMMRGPNGASMAQAMLRNRAGLSGV